MSQDLLLKHRNIDAFYAEGYLQTWCSSVRPEWTCFLHQSFKETIPRILKEKNKTRWILDLGCGPSISNVISASSWTSNIIMADYLKSNRNEIEHFLTRSDAGFQWDHYFQFVSQLENLHPNEVEERTRSAIREVKFCDVTAEDILPGFEAEIDVVIASLVFDVVARDNKTFEKILENVAKLLAPGGVVVVQGSLGEKIYTVGSAAFDTLDVTECEVKETFLNCRLELVEWQTCRKFTTHYFAVLQKRP